MRFVWMLVLVVACSGVTVPEGSTASSSFSIPGATSVTSLVTDTSAVSSPITTAPVPMTTTPTTDAYGRPAWLGTIALPVDANGYGEVRPTPPELIGRAFGTIDILAPPASAAFESTTNPVPDDVLARSTWNEGCPVTFDDLSYLTVSHWGFDGRMHTGELLVNHGAANDIVNVFEALFVAGYPIEEMRVVSAPELDLPPTGDGNNTTVFVCRAATGGSNWSQHAYGLAIDINPFQNPYVKGDLVLPELANYYTDRGSQGAGMITTGGVVTEAFRSIGWGWGGDWSSLKDWMHFSRSGR